MQKIQILKKTTLFVFLALIIPFGKLEMFNGFVIALNIFSVFTDHTMGYLDYFFLISSVVAMILILKKGICKNLIGLFLTYMWLFYRCTWYDITSNLFISISISFYFMLSGYLIFRIFSYTYK